MKAKIDNYLGIFIAFLMAIMTLDVLWGVFTRYALGHQASFSDELSRFLLIWVGILGAAYVSGQRQHLAIDLLSPKLNQQNQKRLKLTISILVMAFAFFIMVIGGIRFVFITQYLGQISSALQIPMALVYAIVPISGILIIYYELENLRAERDAIDNQNL